MARNLGTISEKESGAITLDFVNEHDAPVTPTSVIYRIDTLAGDIIKASTTFTPTSSSEIIELSIADNTLVNAALPKETRIVTVIWEYGVNKQGTAEYLYSVKNLTHVT